MSEYTFPQDPVVDAYRARVAELEAGLRELRWLLAAVPQVRELIDQILTGARQ